jgi:hypothetical protein
MSHTNAILTPKGRPRLAGCVVEDGWSLRRRLNGFRCRRQQRRAGPGVTGPMVKTGWAIFPTGRSCLHGGRPGGGSGGSSQ